MSKHRARTRTSRVGGRGARRPRGGLAVLVAAVGLGAVSLVAGLMALTLAPAVVGWRSDVVLSGSMRPALEPGDVVVSAPVDPGQVQVGDVVVVRNPARPGHTLVHRVDSVLPDGTIVTRGDANATPDSTTVAPDQVLGRGGLRVPGVGMASVWLQEGRLLPLTAAVLAVAAVTWLTFSTAGSAVAVPAWQQRRQGAGQAAPARHRRS